MPKTRQQKEEAMGELKEVLGQAKSIVFARHEKLKVKEIEELRRAAKNEGVVYTLVKKTILDRAMKDLGFEVNARELDGNYATVIGIADEVAPAKLVAKFAKEHEAMEILGGVLERKMVDKKAIIALAKLPSKDELLAKIVGSLNAPVSGFVNVLAGNLRGLVTVLGAIKEKKPA